MSYNNSDSSFDLKNISKKIAKGGGIIFAGSIIGKVLSLIFHVILGRTLGPASYGLYALAISVIGIATTIASAGGKKGIVRYGSAYLGENDKVKLKGIIVTGLIVSLTIAIIISITLFFTSEFLSNNIFDKPELNKILKIFSIGFPFMVLVGIPVAVAHAYKRMGYKILIGSIFRKGSQLVLVGIILILGFKLYGVVVATILASTFTSIFGFYLIFNLFPDILSKMRAKLEFKKLITFSFPMIFVSLSYFLALKTDRIMLGILSTSSDIGFYNAASNVALQILIIHSALVTIFMPVISDCYNQKKYSKMKDIYNLIKKWSTYGTLLLSLPLILFAKPIISLLYGIKFGSGWTALTILPIGILSGAICGPTGALLQMTDKQNVEFFNGMFLVTINIFLNYIFIPIFGFLGAAFATVSSTIMFNIIQILEIQKFYEFHPFHKNHNILVGFAILFIAGGILMNLNEILGLKIIYFLLTSSVIIFYLYKTRSKEESVIWEAIMNRIKGVNK